MANTISPNMNLIIPGVGTEPGPTYASDINNSLTIIDQHSHTTGSGVLITPAAININATVPFNNNLITQIQALTLIAQVATPANQSLYVSGVDLYYVDGNGNAVKITSGGTVNATSSGISSGTASASFQSGVLVVNSNTLTPANIQAGSILLGNNVASSKYLTLAPPSAMVANFTLTLPSIPAVTSYMQMDTSGNMSAVSVVTRPTGTSVSAGGVAVTTSSGADSTTSGSFVGVNNQTLAITTLGNPVQIMFISDGTGNNSTISSNDVDTGEFRITRNGTEISRVSLHVVADGDSNCLMVLPPGVLNMVDFVAAGTYTYGLQFRVTGGGSPSVAAVDLKMVAYELR